MEPAAPGLRCLSGRGDARTIRRARGRRGSIELLLHPRNPVPPRYEDERDDDDQLDQPVSVHPAILARQGVLEVAVVVAPPRLRNSTRSCRCRFSISSMKTTSISSAG